MCAFLRAGIVAVWDAQNAILQQEWSINLAQMRKKAPLTIRQIARKSS